MKLKGANRVHPGGNYLDMQTGEAFRVSGAKKNGLDRHSAGSGKVLVETAALNEYLRQIGAKILGKTRCEITNTIRETAM